LEIIREIFEKKFSFLTFFCALRIEFQNFLTKNSRDFVSSIDKRKDFFLEILEFLKMIFDFFLKDNAFKFKIYKIELILQKKF
jgi:hypothetical protein